MIAMTSVTSPMWGWFFLLWAAAAAWMDLRRRRVWWFWFILGGLAAGIYRMQAWMADGFAFDQLILIVIATSAAFQLWRTKVWGGADAKTLMVLVMAAPDWRLVLVLALADLFLVIGWKAVRDGWEGVKSLVERAIAILRGEAPAAGESVPLVAVLCAGFWVYWLVIK